MACSIWFQSAGTTVAFHLVRAAKRSLGADARVLAADIHPPHLVAASAFATAFHRVERYDDPAYVENMLHRLSKEMPDAYVPIIDEEIVIAARWREEGRLPSTRWVVPSLRSAEDCLDKLRAGERLDGARVPVPRTESARQSEASDFPKFVKPRRGRGSQGAFVANSLVDISESLRTDDHVIQELCEGPEITVDVWSTCRERRAVGRKRLETKAGVCTKAEIFEDVELTALAGRVAAALELDGLFCFQLMKSPAAGGRYVVTDVNPRPGAGTSMCTAAGVDLLGAHIAALAGAPPVELGPKIEGPRFVCRQFEDFALSPVP